MRGSLLTLFVIQLLCTGAAYSKEQFQQVTIADPYIEMHTGPGKGFPIFHVVDRGESVEIIKRRTDWFRIRTTRGVEGWADRDQLVRTLQPTGQSTEIRDATVDEFYEQRWEAGMTGGDFGAPRVTGASCLIACQRISLRNSGLPNCSGISRMGGWSMRIWCICFSRSGVRHRFSPSARA